MDNNEAINNAVNEAVRDTLNNAYEVIAETVDKLLQSLNTYELDGRNEQ